MRREANALVQGVPLGTRGRTQAIRSVRRKCVSKNCVFGARGWRSHAAVAGFIVLVLLLPMPANGQAMSHDMPGMMHEHGGAPAPEQSTPPPAPGVQQSSPALEHEAAPATEHGGMPGMEHGGAHEMGGMQMRGQFGPHPMAREASGTAWQPDSTPHQGVMFMSGEWMLMGHAATERGPDWMPIRGPGSLPFDKSSQN